MFAKLLVFAASLLLSFASSATELQTRALPDGVELTFIGVDSDQGVPNGALHCVTGTRLYWAGIDGTNQFDLYRMVGGCVPITNRTVDVVHRVIGAGLMCLVPLFVDGHGMLIADSYHPKGPTKHTTRKGNTVTAIVVGGGMARPATPNEAFGCD